MRRFLAVLSGYDNPLIIKDGISRMRSWRAPLAITVYLGLLGAFGYALFTIQVLTSQYTRQASADVGGWVFTALAFFQLSLISLFAPALAAGAISGERERQTFDVLLVSRVSAFGIVWGKLVASLAYLLLIILTALPLFAAVFLFGGIDFGQFVLTHLITVVTALEIGAISLFFSALFRRSLAATVTSYAAAALMTVGTLVAGFLLSLASALRAGGPTGPLDAHPVLYANPAFAIGMLLFSPNGAPMTAGRLLQVMVLDTGPASNWGPVLQPWQVAIAGQLVTTGLAIGAAVWLVRGRRAPRRGRRAGPEPAA